MKKTLTKSEIKRKAKQLERECSKLSDKLYNLMDEAEISAEGMTEKQIVRGDAGELNRIAGIIQSATGGVEDTIGDLQCI